VIDIATRRQRIGQAFDDEVRHVFDVYEAACAWRDDRQQRTDNLSWRDREAAHRLIAAVDATRRPNCPRCGSIPGDNGVSGCGACVPAVTRTSEE